MAFPLGAAIMGGASILGGLLGGSSARKAANAEVQANREALALQREMFNQSRADMQPWLQAGGQAIGQGAAMLQPGFDHTTSPGYDFRMGEGLRAVEGSAAARGLLQSGGTLKGINRFAQGLAADDFNQQFNRQMAVAAGGQQTAGTLGQLGANMAGQGSASLGNIGQARASGYAGQNQAIQGTLGNLFSLYNSGAFKGI